MKSNAVLECSLFKGLTGEQLKEAMSLLSAREEGYKKGELIKAEGERLSSFGLVLSGSVQVLMNDINGDSIIMATVEKGATFGESLAFLAVAEIPVYIYAPEDCRVLWLSADAFKGEEKSPLADLLYNRFSAALAQRALDMNDRIQVLSKLTLREKLLTLFSQYSHKSGSRTFSISLNREQLAAYLGVNRSALSRELSKMRDEGIIEFYKNSFKIL